MIKEPEKKPPDEVKEPPKPQDIEEQFTPEIIPAVSTPDAKTTESKMSITSLSQGSGAIVTIPSQVNKDVKKKERFSLKTSIPISKIDMKCVNSDTNTTVKKPVFNPAFHKETERPRVEIQSNIVIKSANMEAEVKDKVPSTQSNSISTLITAAEAINKNDGQFRVPEPKTDEPKDTKEHIDTIPQPAVIPRPIFNPMNLESKPNFSHKPPEGGFNEKNQLLFLQNKTDTAFNNKMVVIQQQNPQVLLQRTNFESKNLQTPSRLSNQKKKDEIVDNGASKVVSLKRLHQDDCDENDFENLITENQIYGNKIVVKEKSQGTQQEQDLKNKKTDKQTQSDGKNVVLQQNFIYLSNAQFPNLMMLKNNSKLSQTDNKQKLIVNENKTEVATSLNNNTSSPIETNTTVKNAQTIVSTKEIHILKANNNVLQSLSNNINKDITTQKVTVSTQIFQIPMVVDNDSSQKDSKILKKESSTLDAKIDKILITSPLQDNKPTKLTLTIKPKTTKIEETSTLDIYEKRKRLRRLKYLSNIKDSKDSKEKKDKPNKNVITPARMKLEIYKEFKNTKAVTDCDTDSDYGETESTEYDTIIEEYAPNKKDEQKEKVDFLAGFSLATRGAYKEKDLERQERSLKLDSVACAYIAAGRLVPVSTDQDMETQEVPPAKTRPVPEDSAMMKRKQSFLAQLQLARVSEKCKDEYERIWHEILRERSRRNGIKSTLPPRPRPEVFNPSKQLLLLTEINNSVNENNNLIKKRLDNSDNSDIRVLAEKNFSELNRLSKMADRSVKLLSAQETRMRDLNPGFDSENIQKYNVENKDYPKLNIPCVTNIISLKSTNEEVSVNSTQATSMDEPDKCAGGVSDLEISTTVERTKDVGCQAEDGLPWPGVVVFIKSYREYESARKKEISDLHRRNTALRVDCAHITHNASRESDIARALLSERLHLSVEEANLRTSLMKLAQAIEIIRNPF